MGVGGGDVGGAGARASAVASAGAVTGRGREGKEVEAEEKNVVRIKHAQLTDTRPVCKEVMQILPKALTIIVRTAPGSH